MTMAPMDIRYTDQHKGTVVEITVVGKDRKGVVADITNFIFRNAGNIEQISQNVVHGLFGMQFRSVFSKEDPKKRAQRWAHKPL